MLTIFLPLPTACDDIYPKFFPEADSGSVLDAFLHL